LNTEAKKVAETLGIDRNTVNRYFMKMREKIAQYSENTTRESGIFEVDERCFGAE